MTRAVWRYECDNDLLHDQVDGISQVDVLTPDQAEVAAILGWPVTPGPAGPRSRLTPGQRALIGELIAWRARAVAIPTPRTPAGAAGTAGDQYRTTDHTAP